jgi:hypothetical protein
MILTLILISIILIPVSYAWVNNIDYMKDNYPDYKGEDLF